MSIQMVLLPVFVSVGLTFALLLWVGSARGEARVGGEASFANQFELLLLFYVLIALVAVSASRPPRYWASSGSNENTQRSSIDGRGRPLAIHSTPPLSCLRPRSHRPAKKAASKKYV